MKIKYYYSACVSITTPDVSILCDPWFTDGIYDGSWYQFPKFDNPLDRLGEYDYIYISHIHPDHYDINFLKKYLKKYPRTKIFANEPYLCNAIRREGFPLLDFPSLTIGETTARIFINDTDSASDIDTALAVKWRDQSIVNMNDNVPNEKQLEAIKYFLQRDPDVALLGYAGAGPYPQTYYDEHDILVRLAEKKKQDCFDRYKQLDKALNAKVNIPFAGQYLLGGKLAPLNKYRGVPDAVEVYQFDPKAVVLKEEGVWTVNDKIEARIGSNIRIEPYKGIDDYIDTLEFERLDYESISLPLDKVPFERLLRKAYERAMKANEYKGNNYYIIIKLLKTNCICNINSYAEKIYFSDDIPVNEPYSLIEMDMRYLFGLLVGMYHWNNAEVGSMYQTRRDPDMFNRDVQRFLNFFYV